MLHYPCEFYGSGLLRDFAPQYIATLAEKPAAPGPGMEK